MLEEIVQLTVRGIKWKLKIELTHKPHVHDLIVPKVMDVDWLSLTLNMPMIHHRTETVPKEKRAKSFYSIGIVNAMKVYTEKHNLKK